MLVAVGGQDVSVCGRVLLRERGDAPPRAGGPFGQPGRVDEVVGGRTGGHTGQSGGEGDGHGRRSAAAGGGFVGRHRIQKAGQGLFQVGQDNPTISPRSSMSMLSAAGCALKPGIVRMSPQIG